MMSCKDVVKEVNTVNQKSVFKKIEIYFHLILCKHCRKYVQHLKMLSDGFKKDFSERIKKIDSKDIKRAEEKAILKFKE